MKKKFIGAVFVIIIFTFCTPQVKSHITLKNQLTLKTQTQKQILVTRDAKIVKSIKVLNGLIKQTTPRNTAPSDRSKWLKHRLWLISVRDRLVKFRRKTSKYTSVKPRKRSALTSGRLGGVAGNDSPASSTMISEMMSLNKEFQKIQEAMANESRRYQTLSNTLRARHDIAMNTIRNMRA